MQTVQCISHNGSAYLINKSFQLKKKKKQYAIQNFIPDISFPVCYLLYLVLEYYAIFRRWQFKQRHTYGTKDRR